MDKPKKQIKAEREVYELAQTLSEAHNRFIAFTSSKPTQPIIDIYTHDKNYGTDITFSGVNDSIYRKVSVAGANHAAKQIMDFLKMQNQPSSFVGCLQLSQPDWKTVQELVKK